ncbi:hypothetical protein JL722_10596 [Aureococcus anophagefferens]|nr:hypothetical protein JL722_10596 [Aureococcus anophagefferens]
MAPLQLAHETLLRRHQLRGSVLPILTMAYNASRQHLLTADEQALRLFSTRKELSVLWLDPRAVADDPAAPRDPRRLHRRLRRPARGPPGRLRRADPPRVPRAALALAAPRRRGRGAVLHPSSGVLVTSGRGPAAALAASAAPSSPGGGSRRGEAEPPKDDLALIVSPVASLNEHQPRAISTLRVSSGDGGLLIGAIDGTVWVWRLFPSPSDSTALTVASRPGSPEISPPPGGVAPRLVLCWEATPPADDGDDDDEAPSITCLQTLDAGRIAVGFDDGVVAIWGIQLFDGFGSAAAGSAPELCCTIDAHVLEPESDDDDSSSDEESSDEESELDDDDDDKQKDKEDSAGSRSDRLKVRELSAHGVAEEFEPAEGDAYTSWVQATIKATPMRLELLELGMGAESIARRLLLAATSGGLVTLYEILAPEWRVATCADRLLQLRRGALVDWEEKAGEAAALGDPSEHCVLALTDGATSRRSRYPARASSTEPAPNPLPVATVAASTLKSGDRRPPAKRIARGARRSWASGATRRRQASRSAGCPRPRRWSSAGPTASWRSSRPTGRPRCWSWAAARRARARATPALSGSTVVALGRRGAASAPRTGPGRGPGRRRRARDVPLRAAAAETLVCVGDAEGGLRLWTLRPPHGGAKCLWSTDAHTGAVVALAAGALSAVAAHPAEKTALKPLGRRLGALVASAAATASGHLHEVTALDAFPGQGVLLSASLDRSVALWRARPADDAGLELLKCVALGHPIYSAVLVRRRGALDAIVADGAHVSRVSLRGDAAAVEGPSLLNERSHRVSRVSLAQSSTISGTAASTPQLAADPRPPPAGSRASRAPRARRVRRRPLASLSFATVSLQAPSAAQAFASAAALGDLVSSGALPRQSEIARSSFLGGNLRADAAAAAAAARSDAVGVDISAKLLEQTAAFAPALPASRERRENLPAMGSRPATADEDSGPAPPAPELEALPTSTQLAAYPDLVVAFKQRDLGKGFLPGAALPMVLKNWWKGPDGLPITDAHVLEACLKTSIFREADEEAAASMGDEEDDDDFDVVSIDELRNLREIRLERRKNYKRRGAKVTFDELCLVAEKLCGVVGAAPPREGGLNVSRTLSRGGGGWNVPEPFEHLFVDPLMQTARDCLATGNPNPSGSGFEQDGDAPQPPVMNGRTAVREARRVFEGYAEELASAAATKRPPRGLAEATYLLFRQRFGPRQIAEAHIVALLDALFAHGTEAPVLGALSRFIDVKPALVEMFEDGRASLGDNDSHQSAPGPTGGPCPSTRRGPTSTRSPGSGTGLAPSPSVASTVVEALANVPGLDESPLGHWDEHVDAEAFAELLTTRVVAADEVTRAAQAKLFALERPDRVLSTAGSGKGKPSKRGSRGDKDAAWPESLKELKRLLLRFVAADPARSGAISGAAFCRAMRVAYIDFWAMLWTEATLHRRLPLLEELYAIAIDQLIGIDDEVGAALRAFVMHVDRKELPKVEEKDKREDAPGPGRPVLEPVEVKPSLLALAFPGQLDMGDLDRVPDLHPGTLTIARPPDAARDRERDVFGDTEGASRAATAHDEREDRPDRSISEERRASLREKSTSTRASGVALVQDDVSSHVDVAPEPPEAFRPAASFSRSLQSSASRDDFRDESVDVHSTIQTLPRSFTAAGAQAAAQLMLDGLARHHAAEALTHARRGVARDAGAHVRGTFAYQGDPFFAPQVTKQTRATKADARAAAARALARGASPLLKTSLDVLRVQSMTGQYDSFGRAFSPVRYLSLDEAEQLQRDIDAAQDEADAKRLAKTHSKAVAPKEKPKKVDKAAEQRRLLEEEAKRRQEEAMRRHEEELERRRQEEEAQAKAAEEAKKRAEEKAAMDEAAAKKKAEEEEAARLKAEQERRLKDLEAAKQAEAREKAEAKRRQAEEERAAADAEKKRLEEVAAAEKEARKQAEREARKRQEGERQAMYQEERLGHMMREQLREERAAAERKRLQDIKDAEIAREAEENRLMEEAEEEGEFLREEEREKARAAQEALEREKQEREREEFERAERERNTRKARVVAFKDKLLGKVAQRRATVAAAKQAEEEAAKLEAEAAATARKMGDLSSMMSATSSGAASQEPAQVDDDDDGDRPLFGCSMAFSADLRYDPFAEDLRSTKQPAAPVGSAVAAMRAKQDDAGAGGFDETSLEDDRLPEAVLRCFREAAGGGPQAFYDAVSDLYTPEEEAAGANEADVVVAHPNVWEKYFEAKLDEVFRTDDVANPRTAKESPEDHRARLEDVLRQSSGLFAALGNRRAKDLLGDANTQDAARAYRRVLAGRPEDGGSVATQQSADLGAANMPSPDDTAPLAFGVVKHASVPRRGAAAYFNVDLDTPNCILTVMLVCFKGDADLLVSRGRIPSASDADWQDTSLGQEKRVVVAPEDDRYGSGKHAIAIRATHADGCSFAVYAATTGATKASVASEPMRALEPRLRKLKLLGEMGTGALLRDFGAAANDAAELVAREVALEQAIASGMRADELVSRSDFQSEQKRNEELRREAKRVAMEVGSKRDLGDAAGGDEAPGPAAAPGDIEPDHIDAKLDQRDLEEAWNVSLSELDNEDNAEDAVAFEKLLYRVGVAQMQAENASKPLQRDRHLDARAPASASSPGKRKKRRRRKKRSEVMEPGETVDDLDARMRAFVGTNGNWNKGVNARKAPRSRSASRCRSPSNTTSSTTASTSRRRTGSPKIEVVT